jgi:hypothetical protein
MGMNSFEKEKFHAANGKAQHALMKGSSFFFFWEGAGGKFPIMFPIKPRCYWEHLIREHLKQYTLIGLKTMIGNCLLNEPIITCLF